MTMATTESGKWRQVNADPAAAVKYLELVSGLVHDIKRRTNAALRIAPGQHVLEVGCGVGRDSEHLASLVGPDGHVTGTDLSSELIAQAQTRTAALGLPLSFQTADVMALPFADESFDAARVERTLQHLPDPALAVRELARVVRPGGRIVAFEPDWDSMTVAGGDRAVLRILRHHHADTVTAHGCVGRDSPALLAAAGCTDLSVEGVILGLRGLALADQTLSLSATLGSAIAAGLMTEAAGQAWWSALAARDLAGTFYASVSGTIVAGVVAERA